MKARFILFFALFFALLAPPDSQAQTPMATQTQIGSTASTTTYSTQLGLYHSNRKYSETRIYVFQPEINGGAQNLNGISFYYPDDSSPITSKTNCSIYIYPVWFWYDQFVENCYSLNRGTLVYSGNLNLSAGWNYFQFDTPYAYNGADDLVITIVDNSGAKQSRYFKASYFRKNCLDVLNSSGTAPLFDTVYSIRYTDNALEAANGTYNYRYAATSRPIFRLHGTEMTNPLPWTADLSGDLDGIVYNKPLGWSIKDSGNKYQWYLGAPTRRIALLWELSWHESLEDKLVCHYNGGEGEGYNPIYSPWLTLPEWANRVEVLLDYTTNSSAPLTLSMSYQTPTMAQQDQSSAYILRESSNVENSRAVFSLLTFLQEEDSNTFRLKFGTSNSLPTQETYYTISNLRVNPIRSYVSTNAVFDLDDHAYYESFEQITSPSQAGWNYTSSHPWTICSNFDSDVPPFRAHDGQALKCFYNTTVTNRSFPTTIHSPKFTIPTDRTELDSVILDFWYCNPEWGTGRDTLAYAVDIYGAYINQPHSTWVHVRQGCSAFSLPDTFDVRMIGQPHYGRGIYIDDVRVSYKRYCTVQASAAPSNGGYITGRGCYPLGSQATLTATPRSGFTFQYWAIGNTIVGTSPTLDLTLTENNRNVDLTAVFTPEIHDDTTRIPQEVACQNHFFNVQPNNPAYGTTTIPYYMNMQHGSRFESLAMPNPGYHFVRWSDGTTANPLVLTHINKLTQREAIFLPDSPITATVPWAISFDTCAQWSTPFGITDIVKYTAQADRPMVLGYDNPMLTFTGSGIFILPQFNLDLYRLSVSFTYTSTVPIYVGICTDPSNPDSFEWDSLSDETSTETTVSIPLSGHLEQTGYIAIKYGDADNPAWGYTLQISNISVTENR